MRDMQGVGELVKTVAVSWFFLGDLNRSLPKAPNIRNRAKIVQNRAFLNLWFAKPMVCVRVAFHENDGNHDKEFNAGFAEVTATTKMTKTTGIQGANHGFPVQL